MTVLTPKKYSFETSIESRLDGFGIRVGELAPADDTAFPQEAISDLPAIEGRQAKDYFSIQLGLFAEGVRIDEDARRQITREYSNELTHSALSFYRAQNEELPQNEAYLNCMDYLCRELEERKTVARNETVTSELTERPQQQLFMLGVKYYKESLVMYATLDNEELPESQISILLHDISVMGALKLYQQVAYQNRQDSDTATDCGKSTEAKDSLKKHGYGPTLRLAARTIVHNLTKVAS